MVRSPDNPGFHWGNFLLACDPGTCDDAERWLGVFAAEFPDAGHVAIGLPREPAAGPWTAAGLVVECDEVLSTRARPDQRPAPDGYQVRQLREPDDWAAAAQADIAENARTGEHPDGGYRAFALARWRRRAELSERGAGAFFAAFHDAQCVSQLGIVLCGALGEDVQVARYQSVLTSAEHRGRGLAGHLIGVASGWAAERGAGRWVIATESDNPAGRLYRGLGFAPDARSWQAYRSAPASPAG